MSFDVVSEDPRHGRITDAVMSCSAGVAGSFVAVLESFVEYMKDTTKPKPWAAEGYGGALVVQCVHVLATFSTKLPKVQVYFDTYRKGIQDMANFLDGIPGAYDCEEPLDEDMASTWVEVLGNNGTADTLAAFVDNVPELAGKRPVVDECVGLLQSSEMCVKSKDYLRTLAAKAATPLTNIARQILAQWSANPEELFTLQWLDLVTPLVIEDAHLNPDVLQIMQDASCASAKCKIDTVLNRQVGLVNRIIDFIVAMAALVPVLAGADRESKKVTRQRALDLHIVNDQLQKLSDFVN